ncbi:MAG: 16S rRNA (guanine(527)-N(7))-methyltransferase RsmG [Phycisphaerales bacterium]
MTSTSPAPQFLQSCQTLGLSLSHAELDQLTRYLDLLLETNKQFNLTAIVDPEKAWLRHILDSLSLLPHIPTSGGGSGSLSLIDVGSGGGLPGIPLAICLPQVNITLLEATGKKAHFLEQAARDLQLANVRVIHERAETLGQHKNHRQQYDLAIARAVGPLRVLLELTLPFVKVGGKLLAMKGIKAEAELAEATDAVMLLGGGEFECFEAMPGLDDEAVIIEIAKADQTPKKYPRLPGEPKLHPL